MKKHGISLAESAVLLLVVTLLASIYVLFSQEQQAKTQMFERSQESLRVLANFAHEAQEQYTNSISSALTNRNQKLSTDLSNNLGSIHYPASFSRRLTQRFSSKYPNAKFAIYSNDPFSTSKERTLDSFASNALAVFEDKPTTSEYWHPKTFTTEHSAIRLAVPIIMQKDCISCHNSPIWNLNKRDWKVGDIRGVREISLHFPDTNHYARLQFHALWISILVSCSLGLFLVLPAVRREVGQRTDMERLNNTLHQRATELQAHAITDTQTGLSNRRHFDNLINAYVEEFRTQDLPIGVAIFDLDHFKSINDNHGHDVGDYVIAEFGNILKKYVRKHDFAARIGGEEFALVIPHVTKKDLLDRANQVRRAVEQMQLKSNDLPLKITVSVGVAVLSSGDGPGSLLKRADRKLYEAKNSGRNRVSA